MKMMITVITAKTQNIRQTAKILSGIISLRLCGLLRSPQELWRTASPMICGGRFCGVHEARGQSIAEYAILFVVFAAVLIYAIIGNSFNGPISTSLNIVFTRLIDDISNSVNNLVNGSS